MTDQLRISDTGDIEAQPLTWDGEPLWSQDTVQEGLFAVEAFEQMPGQMAMSAAERWPIVVCQCCRQDFHADSADDPYCARCMEMGR